MPSPPQVGTNNPAASDAQPGTAGGGGGAGGVGVFGALAAGRANAEARKQQILKQQRWLLFLRHCAKCQVCVGWVGVGWLVGGWLAVKGGGCLGRGGGWCVCVCVCVEADA